jgi:type VI protein secretion system component VasK
VPDLRRGLPPQKATRIIWLVVAALASIISFFLAWPYSRDFSYWPESQTMWTLYFVVEFVLAVYVFHVFFGSLRTLFEHDAIERAELADSSKADDPEYRP